MENPQAFEKILASKKRLKLISLCLGPFSTDPSDLKLDIKTRDFLKPKLFKPLKEGEKNTLKAYLQCKK